MLIASTRLHLFFLRIYAVIDVEPIHTLPIPKHLA